ncbi:MAG: ABC transporter ATP-binding protein [Flavonifractor plautii]
MNAVVETRGLCKQYGPALRVNHLDLTVPEGAVYGFLGPNGAGKSTTLKLLLGLARPTAGNRRLWAAHGSPHPHGDSQAGGQPDREPQLLRPPDRRGEPAHRPNPARGAGAGHREVLRIVRLDGQKGKRTAHYSLGMKQRLGLAAALLGFPRLLILDEPTNGLDPAGIQEMRELIRSLPGRFGMTVVVSSHLLSEIDQMADHVGIIRGEAGVSGHPVRAPRPQLPPPGPAHHRQRRGSPPAGREPCPLHPGGRLAHPSPALRRRCSQSLPLSGLPPGGSSAHGGAAEEPGRPLSGAHRKGGEPVKLLALEFCKCRRRKLTLVCAGLLAAQLLWFGAYLTRQDAEALAQGGCFCSTTWQWWTPLCSLSAWR